MDVGVTNEEFDCVSISDSRCVTDATSRSPAMSRSTRGREIGPMELLVLTLAFRLALDRLFLTPKLEGTKGENTDDREEVTGKSMGSEGTLAMGADGGIREGRGRTGGLTGGPRSSNWLWFWVVSIGILLRVASFRRSRRTKKTPRIMTTTTMTVDAAAMIMTADL